MKKNELLNVIDYNTLFKLDFVDIGDNVVEYTSVLDFDVVKEHEGKVHVLIKIRENDVFIDYETMDKLMEYEIINVSLFDTSTRTKYIYENNK